ncbi:unnamed protein product [Bursaphelenchus xylophilus]|uniref:(pine wood nematode) hypothetical protein n=1 Tax=Bursaphelenchus xylophilus TaxID=6326 RepID=A0A811K7M9_BURXY|nr:unnamed protein product [Bursaphelenchus xylophilus]CAG9088181.1 unnamed protein product [Bursaphelenchus xylophilus]
MSPGGRWKIENGCSPFVPGHWRERFGRPEHPGPPLDPEGLVENNRCSAGPNEPMPNKSMKEQETKVEHPSPPNEPGGPLEDKNGCSPFVPGHWRGRFGRPEHPGPPLDPEGLVENNGCSAGPNERMSTTRLLPRPAPTPENTTSSAGQSPRNPSREYYPIFTVETREYLNNLHIDLRHFLNEFVDFVYYNKPICEACIRPMLIFAHDNELVYLKGKMEAAIAMQPPISTNIMREHLSLASKYGLDNLLRTTLVRAEGHYITVAQALVGQSGIVNELTIPTMRKLADRLCTGWSLINWKMAERTPTTRNVRRIFLDEGGPVGPTANPTLESFYGYWKGKMEARSSLDTHHRKDDREKNN